MIVQQILDQKSQGGVTCVPPSMPVSEAAKLLSEHRIGALVVSSDGVSVAGILSERDIVRELGRRGAACMSDSVERMMTARVQGCALEDTAEDVLEAMSHGRFRHMPVMRGDKMVGVISIGDVVKARLSEMHMEKNALEDMIKGF